jgi:hypothetical protein
MSIAIKQGITVITLKTDTAHKWVSDNICLERKQWVKNEDTGELAFCIDSIFSQELLDEMTDELIDGVDFTVTNKQI